MKKVTFREPLLNDVITHDDVARKARQLWEEAGKPSNKDLYFWLKAERICQMSYNPWSANQSCRHKRW